MKQARPCVRIILQLALLGSVGVAGCGDLIVEPAARLTTPLALSVTAPSVTGGPAAAFDKTDRIEIRVLGGGGVLLAISLPFGAGSEARFRIDLPREAIGMSLTAEVTLLRGDSPLFTGAGSATLAEQQTTPLEIALAPVVAAIETTASVPPLPSIGSTTRLLAAAVFATGDTIPDVAITWSALDAGIVQVAPDGTVQALAEGSARVQAAHGSVTTIVNVTVVLVVDQVEVSPPSATLLRGATQQFTATLRDAGGHVIQRAPIWSSTDPAVLTVDDTGNVTANGAGTARVEATADGVTGGADVTVRDEPPPVAPSGLTATSRGTTVILGWTDNADTESSYEVWRRTGSEPAIVIATLGANTVSHTDSTGTPDERFEYSVRACNAAACSAPSNAVTVTTIPRPPSNLVATLIWDSYYDSPEYVLDWEDNSMHEQFFRIESRASLSEPWVFEVSVGANIRTHQAQLFNYGTVYFRVFACNAAGCAGPSNEAYVDFDISSSAGSAPGAALPAAILPARAARGSLIETRID